MKKLDLPKELSDSSYFIKEAMNLTRKDNLELFKDRKPHVESRERAYTHNDINFKFNKHRGKANNKRNSQHGQQHTQFNQHIQNYNPNQQNQQNQQSQHRNSNAGNDEYSHLRTVKDDTLKA